MVRTVHLACALAAAWVGLAILWVGGWTDLLEEPPTIEGLYLIATVTAVVMLVGTVALRFSGPSAAASLDCAVVWGLYGAVHVYFWSFYRGVARCEQICLPLDFLFVAFPVAVMLTAYLIGSVVIHGLPWVERDEDRDVEDISR